MIRKLITGAVIGGTGLAVWAGVSAVDHTKRDSTGTIQTAGDLGVFSTHLGDCMNDLPVPGQNSNGVAVSKVVGVPCNEPHHFQVFFKGTITLTSFDIQQQKVEAEKICSDAAGKLASTFSQQKAQEFQTAGITDMVPTSASWDHGDRVLDCLVGSDTEFYASSVLN